MGVGEVLEKEQKRTQIVWVFINEQHWTVPLNVNPLTQTPQPSLSHSGLTAAVCLHGESAVKFPILSCLTPGNPCV